MMILSENDIDFQTDRDSYDGNYCSSSNHLLNIVVDFKVLWSALSKTARSRECVSKLWVISTVPKILLRLSIWILHFPMTLGTVILEKIYQELILESKTMIKESKKRLLKRAIFYYCRTTTNRFSLRYKIFGKCRWRNSYSFFPILEKIRNSYSRDTSWRLLPYVNFLNICYKTNAILYLSCSIVLINSPLSMQPFVLPTLFCLIFFFKQSLFLKLWGHLEGCH